MAEYWQQLTNGGGAAGQGNESPTLAAACNGGHEAPGVGGHNSAHGNNNYVNFNQFIMQHNLGGGASPNAGGTMQHPLGSSASNSNYSVGGGGGAFGLNPPAAATNSNNFANVSHRAFIHFKLTGGAFIN